MLRLFWILAVWGLLLPATVTVGSASSILDSVGEFGLVPEEIEALVASYLEDISELISPLEGAQTTSEQENHDRRHGTQERPDGTETAPEKVFLKHEESHPLDPHLEQESLRPIKWGEINFLHTTDSHGWLPGHLLEPQFSSDWGDYISFIKHMKKQADTREVDLLVVDTGDRHDGNGFSDASVPPGEVSERLFNEVDFDLVTIGNHELYHPETIQQEYDLVAPRFGERYLTSNVDIRLDNGSWVPVGNRFRRFQTIHNKLNVLAFGFLFDFAGNSENSRVTTVEKAVAEQWFLDALSEQHVDLIVLACHIPARFFFEFQVLIDAIRAVLPDVPIQGLAGHSHIRDYVVFDNRAAVLQSGRFMETVGWGSVSGLSGGTKDVEFTRKYIDFNARSLSFHSNTSLEADSPNFFHTPQGGKVTKRIAQERRLLNLTDIYGCVPQSFFTNRAPYPGKSNIFSLLERDILPLVQYVPSTDAAEVTDRNTLPRFVLTNTGSVRYDLVKGPFTKDTGYIVSPFPSKWFHVPDLPISLAKRVKPLLNRERQILGANQVDVLLNFADLGLPTDRGSSAQRSEADVVNLGAIQLALGPDSMEKQGGYVTYDDMGHDGDDTPHKPWPYYDMPNVIQSEINVDGTNSQTVDLVFNDFMRPFVEAVFIELGLPGHNRSSFQLYNPGDSVIDLLPRFFSLEKSNCSEYE